MYKFEAKYQSNNIIVLFLGQAPLSDHYLADEISESLSGFHRPDALILLHPSCLNMRKEDFEASIAQLERHGKEISVYISSFDAHAKLTLSPINEAKLILDENHSDEIRDTIINQGLYIMAHKSRNSLILSAPTGTIFCKPSGETYSEFIKASELASTCHEIQFIAFSLLKYARQVANLRRIYIDTMSISSYVESLISYLTAFEDLSSRKIDYYSFNSYDGAGNKPDENDGVFIIISASSSNNLSKKIKNEWGLSSNQIVNFLSYKDSDAEKIPTILNIKSLSEGKSPLEHSEKKLKIIGENFAVEAAEATQVLIKGKSSPQKTVHQIIYPKRFSKTYSCNKSTHAGGKEKHISIDWTQEKESVSEWIEKVSMWHIPANTASIIYDPNNPTIHALLEMVIEAASKVIKKDLTAHPISDIETIPKDSGTIILSDVITSARQFISINRELRRANHTGNRIFISPFATFESKKSFNSTKSTLEKGESGFDYKLLCKEVLYLGPSELNKVWDQELELIKKYTNPHWINRSQHLEKKSKGIENRIGSYTSDDVQDEFCRDFAFWPDDYESERTYSSSVYATIASILQNMRSLDKNEEDSLNGHTYQAKILSPDNFWRFNDALIQSCLWRAALHSELDYTGSSLASQAFSDLVIKYIDEASDGKSNIVCDYLIAIAIGKIKIGTECISKIVSYGQKNLKTDNPAIEIITSIKELFSL